MGFFIIWSVSLKARQVHILWLFVVQYSLVAYLVLCLLTGGYLRPHLVQYRLHNLNMAKNQMTEVNGVVSEALPNTQFRVTLEDGREILAHLAGKMRLYRIKVMPGDKVKLEMSPYDTAKGRIIFRQS